MPHDDNIMNLDLAHGVSKAFYLLGCGFKVCTILYESLYYEFINKNM